MLANRAYWLRLVCVLLAVGTLSNGQSANAAQNLYSVLGVQVTRERAAERATTMRSHVRA